MINEENAYFETAFAAREERIDCSINYVITEINGRILSLDIQNINNSPIILDIKAIRDSYLNVIYPLRGCIDVHAILRGNAYARLSFHGIVILAAAFETTLYHVLNILSCR